MATLNVNKPAAYSSVLALRVVDAIDNAKTSLVSWNNQRRTFNELSKLSDRDLADIGLSRCDIRNIAMEAK